MSREGDLFGLGWLILRGDKEVAAWAGHVADRVPDILSDPQNAGWFRHGATWFVGVDCLPNDRAGRLPDGPAFPEAPFDVVPRAPLHPGQLSVVLPGYPDTDEDETPAAARFRRKRDGAHVDGLLAVGPNRRRMPREPHAYILGLPLGEADPEASPLVVWEGSHEILRRAFLDALPADPALWSSTDVTEAYQSARRRCFETCARRPLVAGRGDVVILHRLALHGVAPWRSGSETPRAVAYFRPDADFPGWLSDP